MMRTSVYWSLHPIADDASAASVPTVALDERRVNRRDPDAAE
jgi:hypothetical protein